MEEFTSGGKMNIGRALFFRRRMTMKMRRLSVLEKNNPMNVGQLPCFEKKRRKGVKEKEKKGIVWVILVGGLHKNSDYIYFVVSSECGWTQQVMWMHLEYLFSNMECE